MTTTYKERFTMYGGILVIGLVLFLAFNVTTTIETFKRLFGSGIAITLLGVGFSLVDFAGLARIIAPRVTETDEDAASLKFILTLVWLVAAAADFWLTMVWARFGVATNNVSTLTQSGVLTPNEAGALPFMVACVEATLRIPLVFAMANYGEKLYHLRKEERQASFKPRQVIKQPPRPAQPIKKQPTKQFRILDE